MNECAGVVIRAEGDFVWVQAESAGSACGGCAKRQQGCQIASASVLDNPFSGGTGSTSALKLPNHIKARAGDVVIVGVADGVVLRAVWWAYGLPLLLAIVLAALLLWISQSEVLAVLGIVLGLLAGFYAMRRRGFENSRAEPIFSIRFKANTHGQRSPIND